MPRPQGKRAQRLPSVGSEGGPGVLGMALGETADRSAITGARLPRQPRVKTRQRCSACTVDVTAQSTRPAGEKPRHRRAEGGACSASCSEGVGGCWPAPRGRRSPCSTVQPVLLGVCRRACGRHGVRTALPPGAEPGDKSQGGRSGRRCAWGREPRREVRSVLRPKLEEERQYHGRERRAGRGRTRHADRRSSPGHVKSPSKTG